MAIHNELGIKGEQLASVFLKQKGHLISHTNLRIGKAEIDLISIFENRIIFTEVKTRTGKSHSEEFVTEKKMELLKHAAEEFLTLQNIQLEPRFDIIAINFQPPKPPQIFHIEDAF